MRTVARAATILLLGTGLLSVAILASAQARSLLRVPELLKGGYSVGERSDLLLPLRVRRSRALIVLARSGCPASAASAATIAQVVTRARVLGLAIVMVAPSLSSENIDLARRMGLSVDEVIPLPAVRVRADVVPSILVVDASGVIRGVHRGPLVSAEEVDVLQGLNLK